tara:strand:- start:1106 stop:1600 length:495 start_codon:yes stop_codon:yes gene_type:complete
MYRNVPEGFDVVKDKGAHLQIQFLIKEKEKIIFDKEAFIFRHKIPNTKENIEKNRLLYSVNFESLEIPLNAIGIIIYGLQFLYKSHSEILEIHDDMDMDKYIPTEGTDISYIYEPIFICSAHYLNGKKNINYEHNKNNNIITNININNRSIRSIETKESMTKVI